MDGVGNVGRTNYKQRVWAESRQWRPLSKEFLSPTVTEHLGDLCITCASPDEHDAPKSK